jgi:hypothetical protein
MPLGSDEDAYFFPVSSGQEAGMVVGSIRFGYLRL